MPYAETDGTNVGPAFADNAQIQSPMANPVQRSMSSKLFERISLDDFAGSGATQMNYALAAAGDRGPPVHIPNGASLVLNADPSIGVSTLWADGPYTRSGTFKGPIGGKLVQPSGTGLLFDPFYIGQHPNIDGDFPFEVDFEAIGTGSPTTFRSLSSATFAVASPNGSNAAVFTSRSSDGGSPGSGYALASYVINDRTVSGQGSTHGMWAYHSISVRQPDAGTTFGAELGVVNKGSVEFRHPYRAYNEGLTCSAWLASGAEVPGAQDISAYLGLVQNGAAALTGILVTAGALADRGGGYGEVLAVPEKTFIAQYLASATHAAGEIGFQLIMGVTTSAAACRFVADNNGVQVASISDGANWMLVNRSGTVFGPGASPWFTADNRGLSVKGKATAANSVLLYGENSGSGEAVVLAEGSDTNIWLVLAGKGNGAVKLVGLTDAANDSAAATAGVPLQGAYRTGSTVKIRIA